MAEPSCPTLAIVEVLDDIELHLFDWHEHHLRDSLARLYLVAF